MLRRFSHGCALRSVFKGLPLLTAAPQVASSVCAQSSVLRSFSSTSIAAARGQGHPSSSTAPQSWGGSGQSTPQNWGGSSGGSEADSLTPHVRRHLSRVYTLLGAGCMSAGVGSALMFLTPLGKMIPFWFPMIGSLVPLLWLSFRPPQSPELKLGLFFSFTVLTGMSIAPIVMASMAKGVLGSAIVLTAAVFGGFSAAAYLAPRASMLALQGPLYGMLLGMIAISILNMFYPTAFAHSLILYGGLALFSVFVSVDTQAMIERARCGAGDHVQDAVQMFLNVINIFVRIASILRGE